jgi:AraC-like DNA-binding protein
MKIDRDWLYDQYITQHLSVDTIIKTLNCGKTTVFRYLKLYNIPARTLLDARTCKNDKLTLLRDKDWLIEHYINQHKTPTQIGEELGCGRTTVMRYIEKFNITSRNVSEAKLGDSLPLLQNYDWLFDQYVTNKKTLENITKDLGCSSTVLVKYLDLHGIERRGVTEACIKNTNALVILNDKNTLSKKYNNSTTYKIANELGCHSTTVARYLNNHDIEINLGHTVSSHEHKIQNFLDEYNIEYRTSDRTLIKPLELDIYIPSCNIAIEVNGLYWHCEIYKDSKYHENKRIRCTEIGIRLIQLYEDDINDKWELIKRFLLNALGKTDDERVFARKCTINSEPNIRDCETLLNTFHIQGYASQNKALTLEYNSETVAVMLFKGNVLTRYATSKKVIGGFGKLLKASGFDEIVTFIDLDTFSGETYLKTGFIIDKYLKPDYKYIVNGKRVHKFNYRKSKFKNDPSLIYDVNKTEKEMASMNKLYRIYDSGKYRLIWNKS